MLTMILQCLHSNNGNASETSMGYSRACRAQLELRVEGCHPAGKVHGKHTTIFEFGRVSGAKRASMCSAWIGYVAVRSRGKGGEKVWYVGGINAIIFLKK